MHLDGTWHFAIITSGMVLQLPAGSRIVDVDQSLQTYRALQLLGMPTAMDETVAYVMHGMYGNSRELGAGIAILLVSQLSPQESLGSCWTS